MELSGTRIIAAPRHIVWQHLNDPDTLRAVIPGCEALDAVEDDGFEATVRQKIGPVRATFRGKVTLADMSRARKLPDHRRGERRDRRLSPRAVPMSA
jgi:uncharacterized protein